MNCKPNDLAVVVRPHFRHGVVVGVVRGVEPRERANLIALDPAWDESGHIWLCSLVTGSRGVNDSTGQAAYLLPGDEAWIADQYLRPIRDPGDDAVDETLQWLPAPSKEVAHG